MKNYLKAIFVIDLIICFTATVINYFMGSFMALWGIFVVGALREIRSTSDIIGYIELIGFWFGLVTLLRLATSIIKGEKCTLSLTGKAFIALFIVTILSDATIHFRNFNGSIEHVKLIILYIILPLVGAAQILIFSANNFGCRASRNVQNQ